MGDSFVTGVVAVGGGLLSGLQGVFEGPSRSLATISSSMADIKVLNSHLASGTFLLTISYISDGILLIRTGHSRFLYVSSFTFSDVRLLMWELGAEVVKQAAQCLHILRVGDGFDLKQSYHVFADYLLYSSKSLKRGYSFGVVSLSEREASNCFPSCIF